MKNGNNKSLNSSLKDRLKFEFDAKYNQKNIIISEKQVSNHIKKAKSKIEYPQKTSYSIYKNFSQNKQGNNNKLPNERNLSQHTQHAQHSTERNISFGFGREKTDNFGKSSLRKDIFNETTQERISSQSPKIKIDLRSKISSAKESSSSRVNVNVSSMSRKHNHTKSEIPISELQSNFILTQTIGIE